ncbi:MAG TPA: Fe-S cluster assembly protein SufD [Gemmatimonadales bacterium]|nr:Fe-S cluster assembly protein SufD [Gemmatimonadales bacterium]
MSGVDRYQDAYRAFTRNGGAAAAPWLAELREQALARFSEVGFPTTRQEEWRFTSVQPIAEGAFTLSKLEWEASPAPRGVTVTTLARAMKEWPDLVRTHLARHARVDANPFTALGTAFLSDGLFIHVPAGVVADQPIRVDYHLAAAAGRAVAHPRGLIVLGDNAQADLIESYRGAGEGDYFVNAISEVVLGDGARLDHVRIQRESAGAYHVATVQSSQGKDSTLRSTTVTLGAALARYDLNATIDGTGAQLNLNGLTLAAGRQHVDCHTTIDHARPHGESHELFNGIFDEGARGVFNGRIIVRPGAQRTDSKQTNNNLLLSRDARADSQPQLEIYADDVKCTHGATLGPLDPNALFYLRSRGLSADAARDILTYGFGAEIVERIASADVRAEVDRLVRERLSAGAARRAA